MSTNLNEVGKLKFTHDLTGEVAKLTPVDTTKRVRSEISSPRTTN
jgi:hypothetical protein